jgi:hypothetical protein
LEGWTKIGEDTSGDGHNCLSGSKFACIKN